MDSHAAMETLSTDAAKIQGLDVLERAPILTFHGIGEPQRELDPGEAPFWIGIERFRALLDRVAALPAAHRPSLTFDDGNLSDWAIAAPELERRGLRATFFVLTGRLGQRGSLGEDHVGELARMGMGIGSHGVDHRDWTTLGAANLARDLSASKAALEWICDRPVRAAAIPFGRYDRRVLEALREAGFEAAYSSDGGTARRADFPRPRTSVRADMSVRAGEALLTGALPLARRLRRMVSMQIKRRM
ncbi:polysaccharide deacetylase family protein [Aureimonas sp. AU40]|uniref:polysaccharide deacetylase family protein n=1 Tax=Aureimonas sp. AU40 TaxID=1637747 RepID=UPI000A6BE997|nr:polysaccharide deacetylase family protein [Aureimonas sp. AU40]